MPSKQALTLTVEDIDSAEKAIIGYEQRLHFKDEIATLEKGIREALCANRIQSLKVVF